jgi:glutamyl-tRNA synthetase
MGEGNKKLSKRDPESSLQWYRDEGYLPEGLLNYLALLGWSMGDDQEFFSLPQLADAFTVERVNASPARFDLKKCTAINADWIRALAPDDLLARITAFLGGSGLVASPPTPRQAEVLAEAVPLVRERIETLGQAADMLGFLLVGDEDIRPDEADAASLTTAEAREALAAAYVALDGLPGWTHEAIEAALRAALVDGLGLKPKHAFGPVRIAITGRRVSPPLFESMEILGREASLARLRAATAGP